MTAIYNDRLTSTVNERHTEADRKFDEECARRQTWTA